MRNTASQDPSLRYRNRSLAKRIATADARADAKAANNPHCEMPCQIEPSWSQRAVCDIWRHQRLASAHMILVRAQRDWTTTSADEKQARSSRRAGGYRAPTGEHGPMLRQVRQNVTSSALKFRRTSKIGRIETGAYVRAAARRILSGDVTSLRIVSYTTREVC
jgi:hypothetical protein